MAHTVFITDGVKLFISENVFSATVLARIERAVQLLESFPEIGKPYDPVYPAARPPFPCRSIAVPDTPFTMYYTLHGSEGEERLVVFYMEHQAMDPATRFTYGAISW